MIYNLNKIFEGFINRSKTSFNDMNDDIADNASILHIIPDITKTNINLFKIDFKKFFGDMGFKTNIDDIENIEIYPKNDFTDGRLKLNISMSYKSEEYNRPDLKHIMSFSSDHMDLKYSQMTCYMWYYLSLKDFVLNNDGLQASQNKTELKDRSLHFFMTIVKILKILSTKRFQLSIMDMIYFIQYKFNIDYIKKSKKSKDATAKNLVKLDGLIISYFIQEYFNEPGPTTDTRPLTFKYNSIAEIHKFDAIRKKYKKYFDDIIKKYNLHEPVEVL